VEESADEADASEGEAAGDGAVETVENTASEVANAENQA